MIRKNQEFINGVNIILDMMVVIFSYVFASWLRLEYFKGQSTNMAAISAKTILLAAAYSVVLIFLLSLFEFYNTTRTRRLLWKAKTIFICVTISILLATALLFIFRLVEFSRGVLLAFYFITLFLLIAKYTFMRLVLRRFRGKGFNLKHIIVIGTGELARQFKRNIEREPELGYKIKGFIGDKTTLLDDNEYLGGLDDLDQVIASPEISEAIIAVGAEDSSKIRKIISVCERNGVRYSVIPFYNDIIPANPVIEMVGDSKLIMMRSNRLENIGWAILKRSFDLLGSLFGLILLSPLFIVIAIGVKCSSPGPIFFRQIRVGYQRREFEMLKFRSLKVNDEENTAWSKDTDPRRTKFGTFIRKTSLDELPQLINVLKGEMSLIGPRPELPHFVDQFKETIPFYMVKHQVKPGMTGWAQVNGYRGDTSIQKRIELDLWYIENWSPGLDLHILAKTFFGGLINSEKLD
ncbi:MAG: undecaprenyl-phosphate glucose phosphotransferase [Lachnospiraceae bacterium]|nr:undecaprenyl-phosphate glucose phosphotransferase [Lachnospiraceae bacterium]